MSFSFFDPRRLQFKKLRLLLAWTGGILLLLNNHITDDSFRWGVPLIILGEGIRIWASGYLERKGKKLATSGPFTYVRNPLYIGNFILGLGAVILSNNALNTVLFIAGFIFLYAGTVRNEEEKLREEFGAPYEDYIQHVPRFFPKTTPYSKAKNVSFDWKLLLKHREYITMAGIGLLIAGFYIWEEVGEGVKLKYFWKLETAFGFIAAAALVLLCEWIRKEIKKKEQRRFCLV